MGIFRSEDIELYKIMVSKDEDWKVMNELGKLSQLHFIDLNRDVQPYQLPYTSDIKSLEEAERKLLFIEKQYHEFGLEMKKPSDIDEFLDRVQQITAHEGKPLKFSDIKNDLESTFSHINAQKEALTATIQHFKDTVFKIEILKKIKTMTGTNQEKMRFENQIMSVGIDNSTQLQDNLMAMKIMYIGGVIPSEQMPQFRRLIIRSTRCQVYVHSFELYVDPADQLIGDSYDAKKSIYILAFQEGSVLEDKIRRIVGSFAGTNFDIKLETLEAQMQTTQSDKINAKSLIRNSKMTFREFLTTVNQKGAADVSVFKVYEVFVQREKAIYIHLNMLKPMGTGALFAGLVWSPKSSHFGKKIAEIVLTQQLAGLKVEKVAKDLPGLTKPTLFKTNEFTGVFQQIVDTYGIPNYKEVNPAVFTCVSFPFFFGVMFGDIMHGFILFMFAAILCFQKEDPKSVTAAFRPIRYMLLLMGFFSFYVGLIYNDFSSLATQIFGKSCWSVADDAVAVKGSPGFYYATQQDPDCVYPFGIDHTWYRSTQEIGVMNSFKMKTSVIYGVAQMLMGTSMKGLNALHFGRYGEFLFDVISQIFLLLALFGFMDYMIIVKWTTDWATHEKETGETAPGIIGAMIVMFIQGGQNTEPSPGSPVIADVMPNQKEIMVSMLILAAVCVPTMLLVNPILFFLTHKKKPVNAAELEMTNIEGANNDGYQNYVDGDDAASLAKLVAGKDSSHTMGEIAIHQMIETIEYSLGTVSNTASYLRLWALSLAHGQLAKVFFDYTLSINLHKGNYLTLFLSYFLFMGVTFAVLLCMDLMEAFLHTLRLHWVEFQNKFYKGEGYQFRPFSFNRVFEE